VSANEGIYKMKKIPKLLLIVSWGYILFGLISMVDLIFVKHFDLNNEMLSKFTFPPIFTVAFIICSILVNILCGIAFLKGFQWSRILYVFFGVLGHLISYLDTHSVASVLTSFILFILVSVYIYSPGSNQYFNEKKN